MGATRNGAVCSSRSTADGDMRPFRVSGAAAYAGSMTVVLTAPIDCVYGSGFQPSMRSMAPDANSKIDEILMPCSLGTAGSRPRPLKMPGNKISRFQIRHVFHSWIAEQDSRIRGVLESCSLSRRQAARQTLTLSGARGILSTVAYACGCDPRSDNNEL